MTKKEMIKQYVPLLLLSLLAGLIVFLGTASVVYGQNFSGQNQGGEVIAGPGATTGFNDRKTQRQRQRQAPRRQAAKRQKWQGQPAKENELGKNNSSLFKPLAPHQENRSPSQKNAQRSTQTRKSERATFIGQAGRLPTYSKPTPAPAPKEKAPEKKELSAEEIEKIGSLADASQQQDDTDGDQPNSKNMGAKNMGPKNISPEALERARRTGDIERMATEETAIPDFDDLHLNNKKIRTAKVQVHLKEGQDDKQTLLSWRMNPLEYPVFINKVQALAPAMSGSVPIKSSGQSSGNPSGTAYERTTVELVSKDGTTYAPVSIKHNRVSVPGKDIPRQDSGRELETWVFGTAKRRDQREIISNLIHVMSYEQCKMLGHSLVDGAPRQCILPDGTTYIEIDEKLTPKAREITNFEKCLKRGHPIVDTFPRQCVAPGGRIYVEPPQL